MSNKLLKISILYYILIILACSIAQGQNANGNVQLMKWRCENGNALLNFNPAISLNNSSLSQNMPNLPVFDSMPYSSDYTMIIVFKPLSSLETPLWKLDFADSSFRALTTENIHCGNSAIRYSEITKTHPTIFSLSQSAPDSVSPYARMTVGHHGDSAYEYNGLLGEIRYYKGRMGVGRLRKVQSELAIRYGITLGPVDYLRSDGTPVWNQKTNELFHHRITALAADSTYGLRQFQSRSEMDNSLLTISTDTLPDGVFIVVGDNDEALEFLFDSVGESLSRVWAVQATGTSQQLFTLTFDKSSLPLPNDSLVLVSDDALYRPTANTSNTLTFAGIQFPEGISHFTLCRGSHYWIQTRAKKQSQNTDNLSSWNTKSSLAKIYPNPTTGSYCIEITDCTNADIVIYNALGEVVETRHVDGSQNITVKGFLPINGEYFVTVSTPGGSQTTKLIVK